MTPRLLPLVSAAVAARPPAFTPDDEALAAAAAIIKQVQDGGLPALLDLRAQFDGRPRTQPLLLEPPALRAAHESLPQADRAALERAAQRIGDFARAQRASLSDLDMPAFAAPGAPPTGVRVGHTVIPVDSVGCYAPGGRFPLPSSVFMTVIPARVAGCRRVIVATPADHPALLAAASIAGADALLLCGGAHALAALALGIGGVGEGSGRGAGGAGGGGGGGLGLAPVDLLAGPGNRYVTAAKRLLFGRVGVDLIAGPSELLILADDSGDPELIAADLLAQAEHDTDARPMFATTDPTLPDRVEARLAARLADLPTAAIARRSLAGGFAAIVADEPGLIALADAVAPEHLQILTRDPEGLARHISSAGGVFLGAQAAEVLGDYGIGPNHTLPTGRAARFSAGLSVFSFCRVRTFVAHAAGPVAASVLRDTAALARLEGLEAHARAAEARLPR